MTLVVCPNLALDRVVRTETVRPGGTMRCRALLQQAGGKGANVARAIDALGGRSELVGFAAGCTGRLIADLAADEGLALLPLSAAGEARLSTVVLGDDSAVTRLFEEGPPVDAATEELLVAAVAARRAMPGEFAVIDGAAPPGASPSLYASLCETLRAAGYRLLVDAEGEQLAGALRTHPEIVKVNLAEACSAVGEPEAGCEDERRAGDEQLAAEGFELSRRLVAAGAGGAVVTLGAAGACALLDGREWRVRTAPVAVVNPVGSGDCFAAALLVSLERRRPVAEALALAAGVAAANAASPLTGHFEARFAHELAATAAVVLH